MEELRIKMVHLKETVRFMDARVIDVQQLL